MLFPSPQQQSRVKPAEREGIVENETNLPPKRLTGTNHATFRIRLLVAWRRRNSLCLQPLDANRQFERGRGTECMSESSLTATYRWRVTLEQGTKRARLRCVRGPSAGAMGIHPIKLTGLYASEVERRLHSIEHALTVGFGCY